MENDMDALKSVWKAARNEHSASPLTAAQIIEQANAKKKKTIVSHWGNIVILSFVAVMLTITWDRYFPFQDLLSRAGVVLMIGGLVIRVAIEVFSVVQSAKVNLSSTTVQATDDAIAFYKFRKKIHGPVTIIIVALYMAGFYMLSPELSRHLSVFSLVVWDVSFLAGAAIMVFFIRKGLRQEIDDLASIVRLRRELHSNS